MGYKLLLADDSITIQKVVELVLAGEGFDIKATNNGDEALSALAAFTPDVVLADIAMPVMNGYQLCEKIKLNPATKDIPVILLAGAFEPIDEEVAQKVGADDYIVKPFESQELISKVNAVLVNKTMTADAGIQEESEAVEAIVTEDDLWMMEEIAPAEVAEEVAAETLLDDEAGLEAAFSAESSMDFGSVKDMPEETTDEATVLASEDAEEFAMPPQPAPQPAPVAPVTTRPSAEPSLQARIETPSREEVAAMLRRSFDEKIGLLFTASDIRDILRSSIDSKVGPLFSSGEMRDLLGESITSSVRDSAAKLLSELAPRIIEKLLSQTLQGIAATLAKDVEKVIWETVPDLAETIISREIEKIKSEL
ncbi:MAG TPA: response regulator [Thermodesulfovibrionales bacterium]|nr:response regulator [Thermodesulfovibrionales bacterium]